MSRWAGWRRNLYVTWIVTFASLAGGQLANPFIPLFVQRDLGVGDPGEAAIWSGLAMAVSGVVMALVSPVWGILADRHGRKAMVVRAQFAIAISNAVLTIVVTPWQFVAARAVQGGFSGVVGATRALIASSVPRDRVAYGMGVIQSAIFLGLTLGPAAGGVVGATVGFRTAFLLTSVINVVSGTLAVLYIREGGSARPDPARTGERGGLRQIVRSSAIARLIAVLFLSAAATTCIRPVLPLLLAEIDPADDVTLISGIAFAALGAAGAVASVAASRAGGRLGLNTLLTLAAVGAAVSNMSVVIAGTAALVIALLFGVGIFQGLLTSASTALLSLHAPADRQGTVFGVLASAQAVAVGIGPLLGGLVASAVGLSSAFAVASAMMVVATVIGMSLGPAPRPVAS